MPLPHTFSFTIRTVKKLLLPFVLLYINPLYSQVADSALIESIYYKGGQYINTNPHSASWFFEIAKKESENRKYLPGIVMYHNFNASLQIALGQNQKAFEYYENAIAIAKNYNLTTDLGLSYIKKGVLNQLMGEYAHAAECYLIAASLLKTNADKKKVIGLYKNIITTLNNLQQQNQSLQNVLPALKNDDVNEKEIVSILSQKKADETSLDFPDQTTLSEISGGGIYVIFGGAKFYIADFYILNNYSNYRSVRKIPDGMISRIPDIPREGTILRESNDRVKVYLIKNKMRHLIENPKVLEFFGGWDALCIVPQNGLKQIPDGGDIVTLQNVLTTFNFKQEYEVLIDTLKTTLIQNTWLLGEVGKKLKAKNNKLQNRKILLWTFLVGIVALLSIGILLVRNFRQKQKLHQQSLKALKAEDELKVKTELEKERTRIASDMHDDLGAGLTRIKFIAENISEKSKDETLQPDIKKLKASSIELVENMAEIIWAMNEKNNSLEDLVFYLRSYAVDYCTENGLACEFILPENIQAKIIGGEVRRNIYLILKESLHNIVKHADAKKVTIDFQTGGKLSLIITDDGKGFKETIHQSGNGLLNIEQRVKVLKGKFSISNSPGTAIHFEMPL